MLASLELVCRGVQNIEESCKDRVLDGRELSQGHFLMSGAPSRGALCICPELTKFTAVEESVETSILRERRKAREEIAFAKAKGSPKKGNKNGPSAEPG